jgi:23S rRNA (adenine2503-C2)-methyltransferase
MSLPSMPIKIIGLSRDQLVDSVTQLGEKPFRAKQLWSWIYNHGVTDFEQMTNISKATRQKFAQHFIIDRPKISQDHISSDGTRKWLLKFDDGHEAEMVYIPEEDRGTLCISSQIGCTLTCTFCHTGTQKLVRNLEPREIVQQIMVARDALNEWPSTQETRLISNIVFMGMGEPFYNYENVAIAIKIIMDKEGIALSRRRITVSTSGVVPQIERCGKELGVNLAISLHAVNNELRNQIVPLNKKYPLEELLPVCRNYQAVSNSRRMTFEYVMLKGVNDSLDDAKQLVKLIEGIPAIVNIIPFNPWPGTIYECSEQTRIDEFIKIVNKAGFSCPVRTPRGRDILAACGQLRSESLRASKSILKKFIDEQAGCNQKKPLVNTQTIH